MMRIAHGQQRIPAVHDPVQIRDDRFPFGMTPLGLQRHHFFHQPGTMFGHRRIHFPYRDDRFDPDLADHFQGRLSGIRGSPGDEMIQGGPERIDVRPIIGALAVFRSFGTHVVGGADQHARNGLQRFVGFVVLQTFGNAQIHNTGISLLVDHDIRGLDVAVQHPIRIPSVAERFGDMVHVGQRFRLGNHALPFQAGSEILPIHVRHGQKMVAVVLSGLECRNHVGMLQPGRHAYFMPKTLDHPRIAGQSLRQHLQGHHPIHAQLPSQKNLSHPPAADFPLNQKVPQGRPWFKTRQRSADFFRTGGTFEPGPGHVGVHLQFAAAMRTVERDEHTVWWSPIDLYRLHHRHGIEPRLIKCRSYNGLPGMISIAPKSSLTQHGMRICDRQALKIP